MFEISAYGFTRTITAEEAEEIVRYYQGPGAVFVNSVTTVDGITRIATKSDSVKIICPAR